jgi:MFS family permease
VARGTAVDNTSRSTSRGKQLTLLAAILGLSVTILDETVVFIALPAIEGDLQFGLTGHQWVVNSCLLPLSALLLLGGSLGDRYGRRRLFVVGLATFGAASLAAGLAPTAAALLAARAVQGVGAAMLMPATLALVTAAFAGEERGGAIGSWAAWSGVAAAVGPLVAGAALAAAALGCLAFVLVQGPAAGWTSVPVLIAGVAGVVSVAGSVVQERRAAQPMLPLELFAARNFSAGNATTLAIYAVFNGNFFILSIYLQTVLGYSPLEAGAATVPVTLLMIALSSRIGRASQRVGSRAPMTVGPMVAALRFVWLAFLEPMDAYWAAVLPGVVLFGLGLATTVAPLTTTVMNASRNGRRAWPRGEQRTLRARPGCSASRSLV